jgi:hypothetical protein
MASRIPTIHPPDPQPDSEEIERESPAKITGRHRAALDPQTAMVVSVVREVFDRVGDVGKLAKGSSDRLWALWMAVGMLTAGMTILTAAFTWHVQGDGTVRYESMKTRGLVVWLVQCEVARQNGDKPPPLPIDLL